MEREIRWIRQALARDRTKTQAGLAKAMNLDKSTISRLLRGERRLKFAESYVAAEYLGVSPPAGFAEEDEEFRHEGADNDPVPLFQVEAETEQWLLNRNTIIERKLRLSQLLGADAAFGFYAPDNVMAPRFRIGEIAWVNPARPATPGGDALLVDKQSNNGREKIILCELRDIQDNQWRVHQYGADKTQSFPRSKWRALHVLSRA